jgi:hypothetical protein
MAGKKGMPWSASLHPRQFGGKFAETTGGRSPKKRIMKAVAERQARRPESQGRVRPIAHTTKPKVVPLGKPSTRPKKIRKKKG